MCAIIIKVSPMGVAHRLASIKEFDRIIVFRDGKIIGDGTFEELLVNNGYFLELYKREQEKA